MYEKACSSNLYATEWQKLQVLYKSGQEPEVKTELRAREEEERFRTTFNYAPVGIAHVGIDGKWLLVNQKLCDLVGYTQQELQWQTSQDMTHPDDRDIELEYLRRMLSQEMQTYTMEKRYICKNGSVVWINLTASLVCETNSKPKYFIFLVSDISERKQAEIKLQQEREKQKQVSELKARFVCMVSHELRSPLHRISFSTSLLKRYRHQWNDDKTLKYLHHIQTAVEHLGELMDNVLIIGRSEAGKLRFEPIELNLEQFCRDLIIALQQSRGSKHPIILTYYSECTKVCVDEKLLQPILTNLLDNAIKYSSNGSIIDLKIACLNKQVIFEIKDQGVGIPEPDIQNLFEPFHRGKNVNDIHGSGLGLAVAKKLVDLHGGQISVVSEVGVGTTFTITLPTSKPLEAQAPTPAIVTTDSGD
jgi:PAS domain S-box-containing protein